MNQDQIWSCLVKHSICNFKFIHISQVTVQKLKISIFFSKFKGDNSVKISSGLDQIQAWPAYFYDKSIHQKLAWMCGTVAEIMNRKLMMTEWQLEHGNTLWPQPFYGLGIKNIPQKQADVLSKPKLQKRCFCCPLQICTYLQMHFC